MRFPDWLKKISPLTGRLETYDKESFTGDLIGGTVVAVMLVPQAMAYAMLAGLPPQVGLYASVVPVILYAFFGTSNTLAVGPVAMVSLLVASGVGDFADPGSAGFISMCLTLAVMVGLIQMLMAVFRFGFLVNFISHPVLQGFTCAAAIIIGFSQLKHLFGFQVDRFEFPYETIVATVRNLPSREPATMMIGLCSCLILVAGAYGFGALLRKVGVTPVLAETLPRFTPLIVVAAGALLVGSFNLEQTRGVAIVGEIPRGLPGFTMPDFSGSTILKLFPLSAVIALVGFLESYSVAKALASRNREKVAANRELFALGLADLGAGFTGGFPVTGGFSRSVVSQSAGVRTPVGSLITAVLVMASVVFFANQFHNIPRAVLAAIIVVAVASLINLRTPFKLWKYCRKDAIAWMATFVGVLLFGIETGIIIGICSTAVLLMWRVSRPFVTQVGRISGSEHFRNVSRFEVDTHPGLIAFRVDASLIFANTPFVEEYILDLVAKNPGIKNLLLIATGINDIDSTGIELLETLREELASSGVDFYLSDVKGPVTDRLLASGIDQSFIDNHIFLSADLALEAL